MSTGPVDPIAVGLPVWLTVEADGSVTVTIDATEVLDAMREAETHTDAEIETIMMALRSVAPQLSITLDAS